VAARIAELLDHEARLRQAVVALPETRQVVQKGNHAEPAGAEYVVERCAPPRSLSIDPGRRIFAS
jgi:hypothetical protein